MVLLSDKGFASAVCKFSGAINAYEHIRVSGDRLAIHEKFDSKSLQKVQVIEFDKDFFLNPFPGWPFLSADFFFELSCPI
jgi:hypothetical protein